MALRLQASALKDDAGSSWTIEIHDSDYVAGVVDFEVKRSSWKIKLNGSAKGLYQPLTPTSFSFTFMVQNATHETFLSDLAQSPENEFTVRLYKGSTIYWAGRIVADQVILKDLDYPYETSINAVCGLSILKDVEYWDDGSAYTGYETLLGHIQNCLSKIGTDDLWSVTEDYLITNTNWFEDHHNSPNDPLTVTRVNHEVFYKERDDGQKDHMSCYEVLKTIATTFAANLRLSAGAWYFMQMPEYANSTQRRTAYYKSGLEKVHSASTSYDTTIDQTRTSDGGTGRWRHSGSFGHSTQLREVRLVYNNELPTNLIINQTWTHSVGSSPVTAGLVAGGVGRRLKFTGTLNVTMDVVASYDIIHAHKFQFLIKVGSNYLRRDSNWHSSGYAYYYGAYWDSNPSNFDWWTDQINPDNFVQAGGIINEYNFDIPIEFITPDIPADGETTFDFVRIVTIDPADESAIDFTALNMTYTLSNVNLEPVGASGSTSVTNALTYSASNPDTDDNTKIETFETFIGDGPTESYPGALQVSDGSTWEASESWQLAAAGDTFLIGQLFCREMMAIGRQPRKVYNGSISGQHVPVAVNMPDAHERIEIQSGEFYFMMSGTMDLNEWKVTGTFLLVDKDITSVTVDDEVSSTADVPILGGPGTGGSGPPIVQTPPQGIQFTQTTSFSTGYVNAGQVDYLPVTNAQILQGQINEGDLAQVVSPATGAELFSFTVAEDHPGGSGGIAAFTQIEVDVPAGAMINIYQPQTVSGAVNTQDVVEQVFQEDTTNLGNAEYLAHTVGELYTDENAGDGSTAGMVVDSEGLRSYDNTQTEEIFGIPSDGNYANAEAIRMQSVPAELTKEEYLFYIWKGAFPVWSDLIATRLIQNLGEKVHAFGYNTNVTTGVVSEFVPIGFKYNGMRFGRYRIVCQSYGSGSGNNQLRIYKNGVIQITAGFTFPLWTSVAIPISMSFNDYFHFEVVSTRATPPQGLIIEMEFIV